MLELSFSYQNILDGQGFALALTGMTIVFIALLMVSAFIALLPRILVFVNRYIPEVHHHAAPKARSRHGDDDEEAIAAAIAYALQSRTTGRT